MSGEKVKGEGEGEQMSVTRIFVGVHGIGDQTECETIQTIIERVTAYQGSALHAPLGKISSALKANGVYLCPDLSAPGNSIGFTEVYWADIPRKVVKQGYVLEETTRWAGSLVEKLDREYGKPLAPADKEAISIILPEAIDSVRVLKRLSHVAEWGIKFKFDLKGLLDSYLGDVQFVTEFDQDRKEVLAKFHAAMAAACAENTGADVYIIAHSEGTVVAFLGLLEALSGKEAPWLKQVKGFMTIGSPIDKHLILWPEMWRGLNKSWPTGVKNIAWHNYYDFGDPVGFELDTARTWLGENSPFTFPEEVDKGFSRYLLPGKAHVDYWQDKALFGDYLHTAGIPRAPDSATPPKFKNRSLAGLFSCSLPYVLSFVILCAGVFIFYSTINTCIGNKNGTIMMAKNMLAFSALLAGIGVAARIPRLIRDLRWHLWSLGIAAIFVTCFGFMIDENVCNWLAEPLHMSEDKATAYAKWTVMLIAAVILVASYLYNFFSRRSGVWFMVTVGSLMVITLVLMNIFMAPTHKEIFPVLIGGAAFLYLWWLSVLVFDLTFIWHQYIRNSLALHRMQDCFNNRYRQPMVSRLTTLCCRRGSIDPPAVEKARKRPPTGHPSRRD